MDFIHAVNHLAKPRHVAASLGERLGAMPVVVVTGVRQTG